MTEQGNEVDLTPEQRAEIDGMFVRLAVANLYELLGVSPEADRKTIRDAYFSLSQQFHPDAWFGKRTGEWKGRMEAIFREVTKAYDVLSNRNQRMAYDASIGIKSSAAATNSSRRGAETGEHQLPPQRPSQSMPATSPSQWAMRAITVQREEVPVPSEPPAPGAVATSRNGANVPDTNPPVQARPTAPSSSTPRVDPREPIIPDRSVRPNVPPAPVAPVAPSASIPQIDQDAARRAAREALARKLSGPNVGASQTGRYATVNADPLRRSVSGSALSTSTLASLQNARVQRLDAERVAKLEHYLRLADESAQRNDLLGVANSLQLALTVAPEDATLRARAEEAALKSAAAMADKYIDQARQQEAQGRLDLAADSWQRAAAGRPKDPVVLMRASNALLRSGRDLSKAAELVKRAILISPRVEAYALLAEIYLAANMKASALAAAEAASKLDPASPIVKDLAAKLKNR